MAALNRLGSTWSSSAWRSKSPIEFSRLSSSIDMLAFYELRFVKSRPCDNNTIQTNPPRKATGPTPDTLFPAFSPALLLAPSPGHQTHPRHLLPSPLLSPSPSRPHPTPPDKQHRHLASNPPHTPPAQHPQTPSTPHPNQPPPPRKTPPP